jgi:hypothetical protein
VATAALGAGAGASWSAAEDPVYGMLSAIDPSVGADWAPPLEDADVSQAAAEGATVTDETCTFGGRRMSGAELRARGPRARRSRGYVYDKHTR